MQKNKAPAPEETKQSPATEEDTNRLLRTIVMALEAFHKRILRLEEKLKE